MLPKGIRLNNPGNIERGKDKWRGMSVVQFDPRFITFDEPKWGIRAIVRIILSYNRLNADIDTVREIINRWAPPVENDTGAYAEHVAKVCGVKPDQELDLKNKDILRGICKGITLHENGTSQNDNPYWFTEDVFIEAVNLAIT